MQEQLSQLIKVCLQGDRNAHVKLYALLAPKMFVVCMRYAKNKEEAEEIVQEGFMKMFTHLQQYKFEGSFEGWVKKIMVNCALQKFRSKPQLHAVVHIDDINTDYVADENITSNLNTKDLLKLVQLLPAGYRVVFNLYVFEGLKHREIAEALNISEGTSKSNLSDARVLLKKAILKNSQIAKQNSI
jgi:RNA polymerase sigma-70 factor, ECF subfamily